MQIMFNFVYNYIVTLVLWEGFNIVHFLCHYVIYIIFYTNFLNSVCIC